MIQSLLKGLLKGGTLDIIRFIKELKNLKNSEASKFLDINGDGKIDIKDVQALQLETFGKIIGFVVLMYVINNFEKIINSII